MIWPLFNTTVQEQQLTLTLMREGTQPQCGNSSRFSIHLQSIRKINQNFILYL